MRRGLSCGSGQGHPVQVAKFIPLFENHYEFRL